MKGPHSSFSPQKGQFAVLDPQTVPKAEAENNGLVRAASEECIPLVCSCLSVSRFRVICS